MHKLLIADSTGNFIKPIMQQLKSEYDILSCTDDRQLLLQIKKFAPDLLLLDLQLSGVGGMAALRSLRSAGLQTRVIAITPLSSPHILRELELLDVSYVHLTSVRPSAVISSICQISQYIHDGDVSKIWDPAVEVDKILLDLGFCMGRGRYAVVRAAALYAYNHPNCFMTKCLYPDVAAMFQGTVTQIEKAIRDAIKSAWMQGGSHLWRMYLHGNCGDKCPSNEVFLAYIGYALRCRQYQLENNERKAE